MSYQDSPKPNNIDKVFVSETERWEVDYFVDHYLKTHSYGVTAENRAKVRAAIKAYPGRAPVKRDELTRFLNNYWQKS